jgi:hypothetical protein
MIRQFDPLLGALLDTLGGQGGMVITSPGFNGRRVLATVI